MCIHVFMCDREYVREYKTESVPSVCEREGASVCACKCVCLCERETARERERDRKGKRKREVEGGGREGEEGGDERD